LRSTSQVRRRAHLPFFLRAHAGSPARCVTASSFGAATRVRRPGVLVVFHPAADSDLPTTRGRSRGLLCVGAIRRKAWSAPASFIEAAWSVQLDCSGGRTWIVAEACEKAAPRVPAGSRRLASASTSFPCQCTPRCPRRIEAALHHSGLPAERAGAQITETVALNHYERIAPLRELWKRVHQARIRPDFAAVIIAELLTRYPVSLSRHQDRPRLFVSKISENAQDSRHLAFQ